MINSITLENYQSHVKSKLDFAPGFNIIIGSNGCGKSAIMRAFISTAFNTVGTSEVRYPDAKKYTITIDINGNTVKREKGKNINLYELNNNNVLCDVNRDVPESVSNVLKIKQIDVDTYADVAINFSSQMDAPFLLSMKDSAKMKFLNMLSGTHAVDLATKKANSIAKQHQKAEKELTAELEDINKREAELVHKLGIIKQANKVIDKHINNISDMEKLKDKLLVLKNKYNSLSLAFRKLKLIKERMSKIDFVKTMDDINKYITVQTLKSRFVKLSKLNRELKTKLSYFSKVDLDKIAYKLNSGSVIIDLYKKYVINSELITKLKESIENINTKEEEYKKQYIDGIQDAKVCPLCGSDINDTCVDNITHSL